MYRPVDQNMSAIKNTIDALLIGLSKYKELDSFKEIPHEGKEKFDLFWYHWTAMAPYQKHRYVRSLFDKFTDLNRLETLHFVGVKVHKYLRHIPGLVDKHSPWYQTIKCFMRLGLDPTDECLDWAISGVNIDYVQLIMNHGLVPKEEHINRVRHMIRDYSKKQDNPEKVKKLKEILQLLECQRCWAETKRHMLGCMYSNPETNPEFTGAAFWLNREDKGND